jgi:hypothetical protein
MDAQTLSWLANLKDISGMVSDIATVIALIFGGIFAWWRWGREKPQTPRGNLSHEVFLAKLDQDRVLLHLAVVIENTGNVPLNLRSGWTAVLKVSPVDSDVANVLGKNDRFAKDHTQIDWPELERRTYSQDLELWLDSGETERLYSDFVLPKEHMVIAVRSELTMKEDAPGTIWPVVTLMHLEEVLQGNVGTKAEVMPTTK